MTVQYRITRILSTLLIAGLCSAPLLRAQQTNPATPQQAPETSQQPQQPARSPRKQSRPRQQIRRSLTNRRAPATAPAQNTQPIAPGKSEPAAAAAGVAGNKRESIASAARACYHVS